MRRSWIVVALLVCACFAVGAAAATADEVPPASEESAAAPESGEEAAPAVALDESCSTGFVCVWNNILYGGVKSTTLCTGGAHPLAGFKFSAKNRCANKASWFRINGSAVECLDAGGNRKVAEFNEIWIGAEGSHC